MITPQQLRDTADAMEAQDRGEPIQYASVNDPSFWMDVTAESYWYLESRIYRPKPKPKTRPWSKPEDVPGPVCWMRLTGLSTRSGGEELVVAIYGSGVLFGRTLKRWEELPEYHYSTDRITWHPCTVEG